MLDKETIKVRYWLLAALSCAIIFATLVGSPMYTSGMNPDEWRFSVGLERSFAEVHGRWATHIGHEVLLGPQAHGGIQIVVCFLALFLTSAFIGVRAVAPCTPSTLLGFTVGTFLVGSSHAYMTEILQYNSLAPWFTLGLLCSTLAFVLIEPDRKLSAGGLLLRTIVSAELLAISIGLYQSFALVGFLLPALALIRVDRYGIHDVAKYLLRVMIILASSLLLYRIQLYATISAFGLSPNFRFSSGMTAQTLLDKLWSLPRMEIDVHTGGLLGMPFGIRIVLLCAIVVASATVLSATLLALFSKGRSDLTGWEAAIRILVGGFGALFILPVLIWFMYPESFLLGRSIAFTGLIWAGVLGAAARVLLATANTGILTASLPAVVAATMLVTGVTHAFASSKIWTVLRSVATRDVELAEWFVEKASQLDGFDLVSTPIRQIGGAPYLDLAFGGFRPLGSFHSGIDMNSIFQTLYSAESPAGSAPFPPHPCPAYPAEGSVFISDGTAFLCFEKAAPLEMENCLSLDLPTGAGAICTGDGLVVLASRECSVIDPGPYRTVATFVDAAGQQVSDVTFYPQAQATIINRMCYRFIEAPLVDFSTLTVSGRASSGDIWSVSNNIENANPLKELLDAEY